MTVSLDKFANNFITRHAGEIQWETTPLFDDTLVLHGFTTRFGGVSRGAQASLNLDHKMDTNENVRQNHLLLATAMGYDSRRMVSTHQIHSDIIRIAAPADEGLHLVGPTPWECDAVITDSPDRPLICYAADCIPILLWCSDTPAIAAIHAGWRGTCADIATKCVQKLTATYGANPTHIKAAIGPGIGACCFSTHDDVPGALHTAFGHSIDHCVAPDTTEPSKFLVDIKLVNATRLVAAGLPAENIAISPECTCCNHEKYWSHRYTKGERGGQAAIIMLR